MGECTPPSRQRGRGRGRGPILELEFDHIVSVVGGVMEGAGVAIIVIGALIASARFVAHLRGAGRSWQGYQIYRRDLGRGLLLGLEFLVAGDIIRTVAAKPNLTDVAVLAIIVLIRSFLSVTLEMETEGRWPWQQRRATDGDSGGE